MRICLGLDTSCYTTSLAAADESGGVIFDRRVMLSVPAGQRGLRQSEALFQHLKNLGAMAAECRASLGEAVVSLVAASTRPRPAEGSYLPVFLAGAAAGQAMAAAAGAVFLPVTHQEGHLRAVLHGAPAVGPVFLAVHLSGGTTEVLRARRTTDGFTLESLGGTEDLHAGQFVDRIGVAMGLPFPAGPALEALAGRGRPGAAALPVAVRGLRLSFSGPLSAAERLLADGADRADLAAAVYACLTRSVARLLGAAKEETGLQVAVLGGGVAASRLLRAGLAEELPDMRLIFADPALATDNAVGAALLGVDRLRQK